MYQEEERKLPVENEFNRIYTRNIQFEIPEGFTVRNLDDLKAEIFHEENGEKSMGFSSNYERDGNQVNVFVKEFYKQLDYHPMQGRIDSAGGKLPIYAAWQRA